MKTGKCGRCGRPLKSKKSIKLGYGPDCYKKVLEEKEKLEDLEDINEDENFMDEIDRGLDKE